MYKKSCPYFYEYLVYENTVYFYLIIYVNINFSCISKKIRYIVNLKSCFKFGLLGLRLPQLWSIGTAPKFPSRKRDQIVCRTINKNSNDHSFHSKQIPINFLRKKLVKNKQTSFYTKKLLLIYERQYDFYIENGIKKSVLRLLGQKKASKLNLF